MFRRRLSQNLRKWAPVRSSFCQYKAPIVRCLSDSGSMSRQEPEAVALCRSEVASTKDEAFASSSHPPLIILHGLMGCKSNFKKISQRAEMCLNRRIILADLRNHGDSPHSDNMTFEAMAADVMALLDSEGIEKATLLGHSLGGRLACMTALRHSERVHSLVVADVAPVTYDPDANGQKSVKTIIDSAAGLDLSTCRTRRDAELALQEHIPNLGMRMFILQNLQVKDGVSSWKINIQAIAKHRADLLSYDFSVRHGVSHSYTGESLFVYGGQSDYMSAAFKDETTTLFPRAQFAEIADAGHWLHTEKPDEFVSIVSTFLRAQSLHA